MYAQVEKSKESKSQSVANSVTQKKSNVKQGLGFVDNRPEAVAQRKLQEMAKNCSDVNSTAQLQRDISSSSGVIQRQISDGDYNWARTTLVAAGSATAAASHVKHTGGAGSPDGHGLSLLRGARDEFRGNDVGLPGLVSRMTAAHHAAIHAAAARMGIGQW